MNLSIVIPTFNNWNDILTNFLHLTKFDGQLEVIIVDNNKYLRRPSEIPECFKIIHEPKPGSYCARNTGIQNALGKSIYFTDSDCYLPYETIDLLLELSKNASNVFTGPTIVKNKDSKNFIAKYDELFAFDYDAMKKSRTAITSNLLVPKYYFDTLGLFNSDTFSGGDVQWTRNYSIKHSIVYLDNLHVFHPARQTFHELKTKARRIVGGRWQTLSIIRTILLVFAPPIRRMQKVLLSNNSLLIKLSLFGLLSIIKFIEFFELVKLVLGMPRERL